MFRVFGVIRVKSEEIFSIFPEAVITVLHGVHRILIPPIAKVIFGVFPPISKPSGNMIFP